MRNLPIWRYLQSLNPRTLSPKPGVLAKSESDLRNWKAEGPGVCTPKPSYWYCTTTAVLLCYYFTTVLLLYYYCATTVLLLYYYCTNYYCTTIVLLLYYYCTMIVLLL